MADLSYDIQVNTSQAERNLANLQKSVDKINTAFSGLRNVLAGISLGAIISQSIRMADAIQDLSDATEISTASILGFSRAVQANGGSADAAQKGLARLVGSIDEAANKAGESRYAFEDVGVSLQDLRTLSAEDIFKRTIEGLGRIDDVTKRAALSTKLLGKEFRGVNVQGVGQGFAGSVGASREYAASIKSAADAQQKLETALNNLQLALLKALKPLADFVAQIEPAKFQVFIDTIIALGQAFVALFALSKLTGILATVAGALGKVGGAATSVSSVIGGAFSTGGWKMMKRELSEVPETLRRAFRPGDYAGKLDVGFKVVASSIGGILTAFGRLIPVVGPVILAFTALDGILEAWTGGGFIDWAQKAAKALGLIKETSKEVEDRIKKDNDAELQRIQNRAEAAKKQQEEMIRGQEAAAKLAADIAKQSAAYKLINAEHTRYTERLKTSMGFQTGLIGLTEDQVELETNLRQEAERYQDVVQSLRDKQQELRNSMIGEKDAEKVKVYGAEISQIEKTVKLVSDQHLKNREIIEKQTNAIQGARLVEQARKQDIENTTNAINAQISRQQALADILRGANQQAFEVKDATQPGQLVGLSSIQRQIVEIQDSARKAAQEAARAFAANFEDDGDGLTPERARELSAGLDQIAGAYKRVAGAQIEVAKNNYETARSFSTGWQEAFAKYAEDALDSSKQAATYFERFTQGFEDAIVSFVTKGKFSFKDFANSIIADFARIQARRALTNFMTGGGGTTGNVMGNLFAFGKSLFGFANGGMMAPGQAGIVGERGPELFVPQSAGKIIPNSQAFGSQEPTIINNAVTYTIQAVDASSFRSLVARDPNFIYAVTEQGRRSQPTRRSA